jgi:hypothetical protein
MLRPTASFPVVRGTAVRRPVVSTMDFEFAPVGGPSIAAALGVGSGGA